MSGVFFWRFGVGYRAGSAALAAADVALEVAINTKGSVLGTRTFDMNPFNSNTDVAVFPVTEWFSVEDAKNVKAAIVVAQSTNATMDTQLHARFANDRQALASDWTELEAGWADAAMGNSQRNTSEVLLNSGTSFWGQLGLGVRTSSASSESRATIHVASASTGK
ncbi:MAG: hypothetical protein R3F61_36380 [Myxococcota bacterium]